MSTHSSDSAVSPNPMWKWFSKARRSDMEMVPPGSAVNSTTSPASGLYLARDGYDFTNTNTLREEDIFKSTQHHIAFEFNGIILENLDKYNDSTHYGLSTAKERELVRKETKRLVSAATAEGAFLFHSSQDFNPSPEIAFQELADLADQMKCAMGIIRLDNARISIQHCKNELQDTIHNFRHARSRLLGRFHSGYGRVGGCGPKKLEPNSRNLRLYHTLVDYMTSSVARNLVRAAVSGYWSNHTMSCLASCTVKLKAVLSYGLQSAAEASIADAESALEQMKTANDEREEYMLKLRPNPQQGIEEVDTLETETDVSRRYHEEKTIFSKRVWGLLRQILYDLLRSESQNTAPDCFQVHTTIYKAGLDSSQKFISIGRLGEVEASAEPLMLKNSFTGMDLMIRNARKITEERIPPQFGEISGTTIKYEWPNTEHPHRGPWKNILNNCNIDEVLSIMVPLSLARSASSFNVAMMQSMAGSATDEEDPILQFERPPKDLKGYVTVTTGKWKDKERITSRWKSDDVMPLTEENVRYGVRVQTEHLSPGNNSKTRESFETTKMASLLEDYARNSATMRNWVIAEGSITFECRLYVFSCVTVALLVVCAGIAVPFLVGNRIAGVDPFQITLFSWLLAGFIILVAKGRYVNEWPWHEFIHGHVICSSLKEVCDATRINDQTVLMYLLLNEWRIILRTRGPYNSMFSPRPAAGDGSFAINRPVHISTMMASGFIIMKIINLFGEHLVCLDTRRSSRSIMLRSGGHQHLVCMDLEDSEDPHGDEDRLPATKRKSESALRGDQIKRLEERNIIIDRILGAYVRDSFFG